MQDPSANLPAHPVPARGGADGVARRAVGGPERSPFGALLRRYRLAAGLSQELLAERAGLSARTLSDLERGVATQPRLETVHLLATALALPAAERAALLAAARPTTPWTPQMPVGLSAPLTPLIGRTQELVLLERFLVGHGDAGPSAPLLLLAGEPGMGKTRLLQAAAQQAIGRGWTVLEGGCYRRGGQAPFAPLLDALAHYLHRRRPARLGAELAGCAWLGRLLPELAPVLEPLPAGALAPEQEQRLVYAAVARFLANVAGPAGTLLVLDDLQWAGPDALDLLTALVRSPELQPGDGQRALHVVGAYRDTEVQPAHPLGLLRADLAQAGLLRHHALGPLAPNEAAELLAGLLGGGAASAAGEQAMRARVLERAGGTPFYLVSYAQALRAAGAEAGSDAVPWDVAQGVRQRVAVLPPAARELLGVAAIVGRRVPWALLVAGSGQGEEAVLGGLEAGCQARLLLEAEDGVYTFAHDVIREVVEADLSAMRRALLHRRVAAALEGEPAGVPAELLAYHFDRGGVSEKAVFYLELAGDEARDRRAHGAAESHYRELLDRLETVGRMQDAARVCQKLGEVLYWTSRYDEALPLLERAEAAFRAAGNLEGLVGVTARMGRTHALRGTPHAGITLVTALLARLGQGDAAPPQAVLYEALGQLLFVAGEYDGSMRACVQAAELACAAGDEHTRALANWNHVNILQMLGRLNDALRVRQAIPPADEPVGDLEYATLAYIHVLQGDFTTGRRTIKQARAVAEQLGDPAQAACTLAFDGWISFLSGDWPGARVQMDDAVALSRRADRSWYTAYPLIMRARLSLVEGAWAGASTAVEAAMALAHETGDLQALRWASAIMAELDVRQGRPAAASARLVPLLDRAHLEECDVTTLLPVLAWAQLALGQVDLATNTVEQALARARPQEMRLVLVEALRVQALVAVRQGEWDEAARSVAEGLELARRMPYPYAEARFLHFDGQRHAALGEGGPARVQLEAALALFRHLGARQDAAQVGQALASLSQNPSLSQNELPSTLEPQVTEAQWAQIASLLPPRARTGRPRADDRRVLEAILYKQRTGCAWADLPAELGDEATAHRRWREWQAAGLWGQIAAIVQTAPPAPPEVRPAGTGAPSLVEGG